MADLHIREEGRTPDMPEGTVGVTVTCGICTAVVWRASRRAATEQMKGHVCPKSALCFKCKPAGYRRLNDERCSHGQVADDD